jgi:hypothetical protein|tara:strand:- start:321 stop:461 length:141 start_codon:yes stop_codon:yes gene_type:complete
LARLAFGARAWLSPITGDYLVLNKLNPYGALSPNYVARYTIQVARY